MGNCFVTLTSMRTKLAGSMHHAINLKFGQRPFSISGQDMSRMKPIARQIFPMITVGVVASVRSQNVAGGAEMANDQQQRFSIAVPGFPDSFTSDRTSGRDAAQTIIADLQADGRFTLVNSSITLEPNAVLPRLDRWRGTNAEWLVAGNIRPLADLENGKSRAHVGIRCSDRSLTESAYDLMTDCGKTCRNDRFVPNC